MLKQLEERVKTNKKPHTADHERFAIFDSQDWFQILILAQLLFTLSDKKGVATSQGDTDYFLHANNCFSSSS